MTLAELRRSFRRRLGSGLLWGVFAFATGVYSVFLLWEGTLPPPLPKLAVAFRLLVSACFFFAFVWLSYLPWQWDGEPGAGGPSWRGALQALAFSEAFMLGLVAVDSRLRVVAGMPASPVLTYVANACFQAPALFMVGGLAAFRDRAEWEKRELRLRAAEAQIRHLQSQLHPHVLFNVLTGLAELLQEDVAAADACLRALADLLRRMLDASRRDRAPLREERALVADYLAVEGVRLGRRMTVEWQWDEACDALPVLPLLLQPLAENAVKHGVSRRKAPSSLVLRAGRDGGELVLQVRNTADGQAPAPAGRRGIGLENLRSRLELAYPGAARFELRDEPGWTVAEIRVTLDALPDVEDRDADHGGR